jgi:hypothetical protein
MKDDHMQNGQLKAAYNVQIGTENQFVLHYGIYQNPGDTTTLIPFLTSFKERDEKLPNNIIADAGYGSEENYEYLEKENLTSYVKYNYFHKEPKKKFKEQIYRVQNLPYDEESDTFECPAGKKLYFKETKEETTANGDKTNARFYQCENCVACSHKDQCHRSKYNRTIQVRPRLNDLKSEIGLKYRSRRCVDVEPVFAQIKHNRQFKRFMLRGIDKVKPEWGFCVLLIILCL